MLISRHTYMHTDNGIRTESKQNKNAFEIVQFFAGEKHAFVKRCLGASRVF